MLPDPVATYKYDRTTSVNATKLASSPNYAKFALASNTSLDKTFIEVRYRRSNKKTHRLVGDAGTLPSEDLSATVKVTRSLWDDTTSRFVVTTAVCAYTIPSQLDITAAANLKDLLAYAAFFPLTAATFTKMVNEEV